MNQLFSIRKGEEGTKVTYVLQMKNTFILLCKGIKCVGSKETDPQTGYRGCVGNVTSEWDNGKREGGVDVGFK